MLIQPMQLPGLAVDENSSFQSVQLSFIPIIIIISAIVSDGLQ